MYMTQTVRFVVIFSLTDCDQSLTGIGYYAFVRNRKSEPYDGMAAIAKANP